MKKQALPIVLILIVMFIVGCATYKMGDKTFHSSSEALKEEADILSGALDSVTSTEDPVHGIALVLLPSDMEIRKNYIRFLGNPYQVGEEQIKFVITGQNNFFQFLADSIRKRGIFDSVSVAYQNGNPASFPIGNNDYVAFVDVDGWFLKTRNNPKPMLIFQSFDQYFDKNKPLTKASLIPPTLAFLDSLCQRAKGLRSK
jgi:hypothetical protein